MDSSAYRFFAQSLCEKYHQSIKQLPIDFFQDFSVPNKTSLKTVGHFLVDLIEPSSHQKYASPNLLLEPNNIFAAAFYDVHRFIADSLLGSSQEDNENAQTQNTGRQLMSLLCKGISKQQCTLFESNNALCFAMCCFVIEACMHVDICPNSFEGYAKQAAHHYFIKMRKSLYTSSDQEVVVVIGYLLSAWLLAQKTEGVKDATPPWEKKETIDQLTFKPKVYKQLSRFSFISLPKEDTNAIIPLDHTNLSQPFSLLKNESKVGMQFFVEKKKLNDGKLLEVESIIRPNIIGLKSVYSFDVSPGNKIIWCAAIQIFKQTVYRSDTVVTTQETCELSTIQLSIENPIVLSKSNQPHCTYYGKDTRSIALSFIKKTFGLEYQGQSAKDISFFKGTSIIIAPQNPIESIIAWTFNDRQAIIDKTSLLGIFDLSKYTK